MFSTNHTEEFQKISKYKPGTQMTLVLIGKDLVLEGSTTKIEVSWVLGMYIQTLPKTNQFAL